MSEIEKHTPDPKAMNVVALMTAAVYLYGLYLIVRYVAGIIWNRWKIHRWPDNPLFFGKPPEKPPLTKETPRPRR